MSTAKMIADSTQSDVVEQSCKPRKKKNTDKKTRKSKKSGKKIDKKKTSKEDELLNDPDLDLSREVHDISTYVKDRQEMVHQMFNAVKGASLQRALPDVLKDLSLEELKQKCMEHLEVMSKKRITRILNGDDPATISSSGTDDETSDEEAAKEDVEGAESMYQQQAADSTSQAGEHSSQELSGEAEGNLEEVEMEEGEAGGESDAGEWRTPPPDEGSDVEYEEIEIEVEEEIEVEVEESGEEEVEEIEVEEEMEEEAEKAAEDVDDASNGSKEGREVKEGEVKVGEELDEEVAETVKKKLTEAPQAPGDALIPMLTKNQMELLELEMRARAIKAMLKKHQGAGKPS